MAKPTSRQTYIDYCMRQLGHPVIKINVAQEQIDDIVDDAIQKFQEFNSDGTVQEYRRHQITQADITNRFIPVGNDVLAISRVLPISSASRGDKFADDWQVEFEAISALRISSGGSNGGLHSYDIAMNHLEMIDMMFNVGNPVTFSRYEGKLRMQVDWDKEFNPTDWVVYEASSTIDPADAPLIWNDILLKQYGVQLLKRQWGSNLSKYDGVVLPGGITLDGQKKYDEADAEIKNIEETMRETYELPVDFLVGFKL